MTVYCKSSSDKAVIIFGQSGELAQTEKNSFSGGALGASVSQVPSTISNHSPGRKMYDFP